MPADPGGPVEEAVSDHLGRSLFRRRQDRGWLVTRGAVITRLNPYSHLG